MVLIHLAFQFVFNQRFTLFAFINCLWVEYLSQKPAIFSIKNFSDVIAEK